MNQVDHPKHYTVSELECIDGIEAALGREGAIDYCRGNAIKYLWRCRYKGHQVEDLMKAAWYCNKAAELSKVGEEPTLDETENSVDTMCAYMRKSYKDKF